MPLPPTHAGGWRDELSLSVAGAVLADGRAVEPGSYALRDGGVLHIHPTPAQEDHR